MNSRGRWSVITGFAGCLVLVGTCWVSGQQGRYRDSSHPRDGAQSAPAPVPMSSSEFRYDTNCETGSGTVGYRSYHSGNLMPQQSAATHGVEIRGGQPMETRGGQPMETRGSQPMENGQRNFMLGQRSSALIGTSVKLSDNQLVGRLEDLVIGESGCVDYMIVSFNTGEFGGRLAAIPWTVGDMDFSTRTVTLDIERDKLRQAPIFFTRGRSWPNFYEQQWAANVHGFFGVESDIDRRIERAYGDPDARDSKDSRARDKDSRDRDLEPRDRDNNRKDAPRGDRERTQTKPQPAPKPAPADRDFDEGRATTDPDSKRDADKNRNERDRLDKESSGKKTDSEGTPAPAPADSPQKKDRDRNDQEPPE